MAPGKTGNTPKFIQIYNWIYERIESGEFRPGEQLPTEESLADQFGVNRRTVRQAFQELVDHQKVYRRRGRGTFVMEPKTPPLTREISYIRAFHQDITAIGFEATFRHLEKKRVKATGDIARCLNVPEWDDVLHLKRVIIADGEPVCVESFYMPDSIIVDPEEIDLNTVHLFDDLIERNILIPTRAEQTLTVTMPDRATQHVLDIDAGSPCIFVRGIFYDENDVPIELAYMTYRGDKYQFFYESGAYKYTHGKACLLKDREEEENS